MSPSANRRLLIVTSDLAGGTGTHVAALTEELSRNHGWTVRVFCHGAVGVTLPDHVALTSVSVPRVLDRLPFAQLHHLRRLRREIAAWKPDIVHCYFFWAVVYGRLLKRLGPVRRLVENREDEGFNLSPMDYRILRTTSGLPDRVICVSEGVRKVVTAAEGVSRDRATVIRNGIRRATGSGKGAPDGGLRTELGIEKDAPVVGLVAQLNREVKGVRHFLDAVPAILEAVPTARFVVVGDGHLRPGLEARARELGVEDRVVFAGFRSDVPRFYRIMDVSALTSLSEGLSITILESMAHGVPVVATRVGGNPELVASGETGLLVPVKDTPAFARAVVSLLRDPAAARRMGRAAQRRSNEFELSKVVARYASLYDSLLGRSGNDSCSPSLHETSLVQGG